MDTMDLIAIAFVLTTSSFLIYLSYYLFRKSKPIIDYKAKDVIIITGCDSGIGLALAEHFCKNHHFQVLACLLNDEPNSAGNRKLDKLKQSRPNLHTHKLDITSQQDIDRLLEYVEDKRRTDEFNNVVALINNAGVLVYGEFDWMTWRQIENQVQVNLLGTLAITKAFLNQLIISNGRIINITSVCDNIVMPGVSVYAATKAALVAFTQVLGYELEKFNVKTIRVKLGDFAKVTNIMAAHEHNKDQMWDQMDAHKRNLYDGYFEDFNELVRTKLGLTGVGSYNESSLFEDLDDAILLKDPPSTILVSPLRFKLMYIILEHIPLKWTYTLLRNCIPISLKDKAR